MMKALVFRGPNHIELIDHERPRIRSSRDAIVRMSTTTICGTDIHIWKGEVPSISEGRILGHEGVGVIEDVGSEVCRFHVGDKVLISIITSCGWCPQCRIGMFSHCIHGGWQLGNTIDGTQAEYVRIPYADNSLYLIPPDADEEEVVMLSCSLPTAMECGTLCGHVKPGDRVAIIGAGPVGLAAIITTALYTPAEIIVIDVDEKRLKVAQELGATKTINSSSGDAIQQIMSFTCECGVNVAIEAVGLQETFDMCQGIVSPGGHIACVGVHSKPVVLHLEKLWSSNISLSTRLVGGNSTSMLLSQVLDHKLDLRRLVSHRFCFLDIIKAYDAFRYAVKSQALKVVVSKFC